MTDPINFTTLRFLLEAEAAMAVHALTYPQDGRWRRWIRTQRLGEAWFAALVRHARNVLAGGAVRFIDPEDEAQMRNTLEMFPKGAA